MSIYDTIIIGGGPAGLSAGIYAMRSKLKTVMIEKFMPGGQMMVTDFVENYPGFPSGIAGVNLSMAMEEQARSLGLEILSAEVVSVDFSGEEKVIVTTEGEFRALTVIIATGANPRRLGVPGEDRLTGRGVSYCATCDGAFFREKEIAVVGGGNTAVQDAVFLTRFASKVTIIHRRDALRATKILQERALKNPRVEMVWNAVVTEIAGTNSVQKIGLRDTVTGEQRFMLADGIFVLIGTDPNTEFLRGHLAMDPAGYILTDEDMLTSIHGVYAAGDCRRKGLRQMVTAASDGAIASVAAEQYIESLQDRLL
ncbi:MAG: thioredoxin-disulfide reductase [Armatimonadota bacterium]